MKIVEKELLAFVSPRDPRQKSFRILAENDIAIVITAQHDDGRKWSMVFTSEQAKAIAQSILKHFS